MLNYIRTKSFVKMKIQKKENYSKKEIIDFLKLTDKNALEDLYSLADETRKEYVGDEIKLRGIIEFSNYCAQNCTYCGIRGANKEINRYRLTVDEILKAAVNAEKLGYKTVVLQSGEDFSYDIKTLCTLIKEIKTNTDLFITLSIGEKTFDEYLKFKNAGADRYLIKHETSDHLLYQKLHPKMSFENRINCLKNLKKIGFETGSGIMVGLPGQSLDSIADDILLFKDLELEMMGIGPYLPHPKTPLGLEFLNSENNEIEGLDTEELVYKTLAVTRIVTKITNLPATTALATVNEQEGRNKALKVGANVIMLNVTPSNYKCFYEIYPAKVCNSKEEPISISQLKNKIQLKNRPVI